MLLSSASPSIAQQNVASVGDTNDGDIIISASLDPAVCNAKNATPLTFQEALSAKTPPTDQCVRVDGFRLGRALFVNATDAKAKNPEASKRLAARRIGIYGSERVLANAPRTAKRYTVVGQLRRCETAWPGAMLVLGYCHYSGGPFLLASQIFPTRGR
jgi:hypothetical protein